VSISTALLLGLQFSEMVACPTLPNEGYDVQTPSELQGFPVYNNDDKVWTKISFDYRHIRNI
jgi:hypothetical protein